MTEVDTRMRTNGAMATEQTSAGITVDRLAKSFGAGLAVDDVSLDIKPGEFATLLGPSGCGKTTTLRCIAGLERPDAGTVVIAGRTVSGPGRHVPPRQRGVGMVFQSLALWPHMQVADNIGYPLRVRRLPRQEVRRRVQDMVELVGLAGMQDRYPGQLSGGQQQRVALARALVAEPSVILYDEPLSSLDVRLREQMRGELRSLHDRLGTTAVYVTHDQYEAMELSDRIYVMNGGRLVQQGTPSDVFNRPATLFVARFLGAVNEIPVESVDGDRARLSSGDTVVVSQLARGYAATAQTRLVVRPQHARIVADTTSPNVVVGKLVRAMDLGDRLRLSIELRNGIPIAVESHGGAAIPGVGEDVRVCLPPDHCRLVEDS